MAKRTLQSLSYLDQSRRKRPGRGKKSLNIHEKRSLWRNVLIDKADELAKLCNWTKDPKYKEGWYKLIKSRACSGSDTSTSTYFLGTKVETLRWSCQPCKFRSSNTTS